MSKQIQVGTLVQYIGEGGLIKAAIVTATTETLNPDTGFGLNAPLSGDQTHLVVFSATGSVSPRYAVPAATGEEGETKVWRPIA